MIHLIHKFFFTLLVGLFPLFLQAQCTFTSTGTGNWSNPATWTNSCQNPNTSLPSINDAVIIRAGHNVTLNSGTTVQVASIQLRRQGNDGAILTVSGSTTELIVGPTGGTDANVITLDNNTNIVLDGATLTITGALHSSNNGNIITSGANQGFLLIENCGRQSGNNNQIGDVGTGCVGNNFTNSATLVYCLRCTDCGAGADGIQLESPGGCGIILLPITLIKLNAIHKEKKGILIEWATIKEIDNNYFEIEHSTTGETFKSLSNIKGFGNKESLTEYSFLHTEFSQGINYYRLKQVDFNGNFTYSKVIKATAELVQHIRIYPNPNDGTALSLIVNPNEILSVEIFDTMGASVYFSDTNNKQNSQIRFASKLSKGIYLAKILTKEGLITERFVVE